MSARNSNDGDHWSGIGSGGRRWCVTATCVLLSPSHIADASTDVDYRKYYEFSDPLDGYSGSDREAVENNINDNIIKTIEG